MLTEPLDRAVLGMDRFFESEYAWITLAIQNPADTRYLFGDDIAKVVDFPPGAGLLYKKNATRNKLFEVFASMSSASNKSAAGFANEWRKIAKVPQGREFWDFFDNPTGKAMLAIAMPSYDRFVLRMHDLDAYNRLVGLRIEMLAADVSAEGVQAFVEKSEARFHHPYTGKPMVWDAASKRLSVQVSEDTVKRKHNFIDKGRAFVQL